MKKALRRTSGIPMNAGCSLRSIRPTPSRPFSCSGIEETADAGKPLSEKMRVSYEKISAGRASRTTGRWVIGAVVFVCCTLTGNSEIIAQDAAPYPRSSVIAEIEWAPADTIVRKAKGGDNWPLTWADDGEIYSTYGDGWGFRPKVPDKLSLGLVRIDGGPDGFRGVNLRSKSGEKYGAGRKGEKAWGLLSVDGELLMWMGHANRDGAECQLAWSADRGTTWEQADWRFAEFGLIGFINFGRDYSGARDKYVYAYSHDGPKADTPADHFVLMRAPMGKVKLRAAWEFFVKLDDRSDPVWTTEIEDRGAVFRHKDACLRSAITFNAGIGRYLWWQAIPQPVGHVDRGDTRFEGGFAVYDSPEPWGPWTTASFTRQWDVGPGEHGDFPSKWISPDGRTLHLVFSGDDCFSVRKATLKLADQTAEAE